MTNVRRKLQLTRAVYPFRINFSNNPEKTISKAILTLLEKYIGKKSTLVILSDVLSEIKWSKQSKSETPEMLSNENIHKDRGSW